MNGGRRVRRGGTAWLVVVALAVLGLSACTHNDPPPVSPTTSSASAQPSPTVIPPTAPKAAPTAKSAEAFVRYFWEVHNYSYATLDTALFKSISDSECKFCSSTIDDIASLRTSGSVANGSAVKVVAAGAPPAKITTGIIVTTVISQESGSVVHSDGSVRTIPGMSKAQSYVGLNWTGRKWLIDDVAIEKSRKTP